MAASDIGTTNCRVVCLGQRLYLCCCRKVAKQSLMKKIVAEMSGSSMVDGIQNPPCLRLGRPIQGSNEERCSFQSPV
jgi:hypothetical protein